MTAQKGKDLLLKVDTDGAGSFATVAGLRARTLAFNAGSVDVTDQESAAFGSKGTNQRKSPRQNEGGLLTQNTQFRGSGYQSTARERYLVRTRSQEPCSMSNALN